MVDDELLKAAKNAAATIGAVYQWLDMVEKAGGATSISGVAKCNAMLVSLRKNAERTETLVMAPLRAEIAKAEGRNTHVAAVVAGAPHGSGNGETMTDEEMEANIDLIAAAPDLLQMLKVAQLWLDVDGRFDMQGINAAIAKAEGRSNV